jgi:hypothetical protein
MWTRRSVLVLPAGAWALGRVDRAAAATEGPSALERDPKGWVDILPGTRLKGWTRLPIPADGLLHDHVEVWKVDPSTRVLSCFGQLPEGGQPKRGSHEFFRYDREVADCLFHVEWRYVDPARKGWNSGVFARNSADGRIWHQAQIPGDGPAFLFGDSPDDSGKLVRQRYEAAEARIHPPGQWNSYELTARGSTLTLWANGAVCCAWEGLRVPKGHLGLEAEYHHIEFRNLKLKLLR